MPIDPNSVEPRIEPLDPADAVGPAEQKITRVQNSRTVGTGSLLSPGVQGSGAGSGAEQEVLP